MKPTHDPIERTWCNEQPDSVLRILAVGLVVGLVILVIGYKLDGTW